MTKKEKILFYIDKKAIKRQFIADFLNISKQNLAYHFNKKSDITLEIFQQMLKSLEINEVELDHFINKFNKSKKVKEPGIDYKSSAKELDIDKLERQIETFYEIIDRCHSKIKDLENENFQLKLRLVGNNTNKQEVKK